MAANLASINGQIAMAYQGETPWHKTGQKLPAGADWRQALESARLNWDASLEPLYLRDGREVPDRKAVIRQTDNNPILATVGDAYRIVQYADAFSVLDDICKDFNVSIAAAGALGKGERAWMLAKMDDSVEPVPGDKVNGYFLVSTGHDGMTAHTSRPTPIRVVCQNTLNAATNGTAALFTIRHTESAKDKIEQARRLITTMTKTLRETGETYAALAQKAMTPADVARYIETILPTAAGEAPNATIRGRRDQIAALVFGGRGADMANQAVPNGYASAWAAYNAVSEYTDHVRPGEAKSFSAIRSANESALFGGNALIKTRALATARQLLAA